MKLLALALLALLRKTSSFPNGAGRCVVGEAAPKGFHADPAPGTGGSLSDGNFVVEVNGSPVTGTIVVPPDTDFDITVSGSDFRGFLIMLADQPEGALVGSGGPESQQAAGTNCGGTASVTHTSNNVLQSVTVTGNLPAGTVTTIEVNVVVLNEGTDSIYHYDQLALEVGTPMTLPSVTGSPTGSPVAVVPAPTDSVPAPTDETPATAPPTASPVGGGATTLPSESIADLLVGTPELSTLASLATDDMIAALSGNGTFTVFAPTNDAFDKLPDDVVAALTADEATLRDVLFYHALDIVVLSTDLTEGAVVTTLNGDNLTVTSLNPVTINDAVVTVPDIEASNGVVHLVDTVLIPPEDDAVTAAPAGPLVIDTLSPTLSPTTMPPANETIVPSTMAPVNETVAPNTIAPSTAAPVNETMAPVNETMAPVNETVIPTITPTDGETEAPSSAPVAAPVPIADLVVATPELSTLASLLTDDLIAALSGDGPFTVFAPVDAAFDKLPADVVAALMDDEAALVDVLTYHVVGSVLSSDDLKVVPVTTALNGDDLIVTSRDPVVINGVATVIAANIAATNGVVHLIDTVLIPPEQEVPDVDEPCTDCPPLVVKGNNRRPIESWPLGVCEGDCDIDSDCEGDLVCFKEEGANTVPGCSGTRPTRPRDDNKVDYCYDPNR